MKWKMLFALAAAVLTSAMLSAQVQKVEISGSVGKLSAVITKPELSAKQKCPMVMLLHGFSGSKDESLFVKLSDELAKRNIASIRFDFNAHGESEGAFENMTVLNEIEDAKRVYDYVARLDYVKSISVAGHSQGGVVASMLSGELGKSKVKCAVLMAPAAALREDAIRGSTFGTMYDPLNPPEYVELPNGLKLGREYIKTAFTLPIFQTAGQYTGNVCLIHGTGDRVVPFSYSEIYHQIYKNSEIHILDAQDHGFAQDGQAQVVKIAVDFLTTNAK